MPRYTVTGPVALLTDSAGKIHYYYKDATLPEDMREDERARLLDLGLIGEIDDAGLVVAVVAEPVTTSSTDTVERPKLTAPKSAWDDYAVSRGMTREEAESLGKSELIERLK
jgi:hypothetical protein